MFPISNHTSYETSTNTDKTSNPSASTLVSNTRIVMRSVSPQPTSHLSPTNSADLHLSDAPLPGTMKFNEKQKAFWKTHTRPEVSSKVQKLKAPDYVIEDNEARLIKKSLDINTAFNEVSLNYNRLDNPKNSFENLKKMVWNTLSNFL